MGANDRIRVGMLGVGNRNLLREVLQHREEANLDVVAVCDIWKQHREDAAARIKEASGVSPDLLHAQEDLFARDDVDAVVIGTPDHQHCLQLTAAMHAGKDVYVEKPLAMDIKELNRAYDAVKATDRVVQMGTQVRSFPSFGGGAQVRAGRRPWQDLQNRAGAQLLQALLVPLRRAQDRAGRHGLEALPDAACRGRTCSSTRAGLGTATFRKRPHSKPGALLDLAHFITASAAVKRDGHGGILPLEQGRVYVSGFVELTLEYTDGFLVRYCSMPGCGVATTS
ncbi:MAG: Gfo/Idh/MocA family oxidoreductase [Bryobacterales bacterium]